LDGSSEGEYAQRCRVPKQEVFLQQMAGAVDGLDRPDVGELVQARSAPHGINELGTDAVPWEGRTGRSPPPGTR
jgi:hypothetical protein